MVVTFDVWENDGTGDRGDSQCARKSQVLQPTYCKKHVIGGLRPIMLKPDKQPILFITIPLCSGELTGENVCTKQETFQVAVKVTTEFKYFIPQEYLNIFTAQRYSGANPAAISAANLRMVLGDTS